jgi:HSP20 family molecular chaperone IbpA
MTQNGPLNSPLEEDALARLLQTALDRAEVLAASLNGSPLVEPPVAIHSTRNQFRMTLKASGLTAADVSTEILTDQLLVKIRQSQKSKQEDDQVLTTRFSSSSWERSFKLEFTPTPSRVRLTVTSDDVTVTASRIA